MPTGILLVAFGSSRQEAHLSLSRFDEKVRSRFPGLPARWAMTSGVIRKRLAKGGKKTDSVTKALEKMWFEKYDQVAVQPLHVIPGEEYETVLADCDDFRSGDRPFKAITVGRPLMSDPDDAAKVAKAIISRIPEDRAPDEAVVLMGHGTWHAGDGMYDLLSREVRARDPLALVATMDGVLTIDDARDELVRKGITKAVLIPLMAVPGRHVHVDMAGDGDDSWKSVLSHAGINVRCVMDGTAEYPEFADIWLDNLAQALAGL